MFGLLTSAGLVQVDVPEHGRHCEPHPWDGLPAEEVCRLAAAAMLAAGVDPAEPYDWSSCPPVDRCRSNLGELMRFLRCESWLHPRAFDEGWVGVDWDGNPVWNRSRGIAQIGDGWGHVATDAEAYNWRWSVWLMGTDLERMESYPECGPKGGQG